MHICAHAAERLDQPGLHLAEGAVGAAGYRKVDFSIIGEQVIEIIEPAGVDRGGIRG